MGFIDYHGTKEDRYTEVLEYSRAYQEEDWKRKDEKKLSLWLRDLTGSISYAQLNVEDLLKYVVVKYRKAQKAWKSMESLIKTDPGVDMKQLWQDFSLDLAARHLSAFPLTVEKRIKYLQVFFTKIFKLEDAPSAEDHYRMVTENPKYRKYFTECFDPTWKGQHIYKWLRAGVKDNLSGLRLLDEFLEADRDLSLFIALYLHQVILPHDDGWMREAETERKELSDIRSKAHMGIMFAPDLALLKNPTYKAGIEEPKKEELLHEENKTIGDAGKTGTGIPDSGLDKELFNKLVQGGRIPDYIAGAKLLLECSLPDDIAQIFRQLIDRMPILQDAVNRFDNIYHADLDQFEEYFAPEALKITAVFLDYQAVRPSEKILKETRDGVFLATRKLLQVVNDKIDEIYRFVMIDANAEAKALETLMSQDGHIDPAHRIN